MCIETDFNSPLRGKLKPLIPVTPTLIICHILENVNVRKRLRILVNVTNVPDPFGYRLEVKKSTDSDASYKVIT